MPASLGLQQTDQYLATTMPIEKFYYGSFYGGLTSATMCFVKRTKDSLQALL